MKTCWSCGAQIEDTVAFCTECGKPQNTDSAPQPYVAPAQSSQGRTLSRGALAGIIAGAVLLCLAVGFAAATCVRGSASDNPSSSSAVQAAVESTGSSASVVLDTAASAANSSASSDPVSSASSSAQQAAASSSDMAEEEVDSGDADPQPSDGISPEGNYALDSSVADPTAVIDLTNAGQYYDANLFLTNFAETWDFGDSFDRNNYQLTDVLHWAFEHNMYNVPERIEKGDWHIEGSMSGSGYDPALNNVGEGGPDFSSRIETGYINDTLNRYLGLQIDLSGIDTASDEDYGTPDYVERDGYLYEGVYRGTTWSHDYVVLCTGSQAIDDTHVRLDYSAYNCSPNVEPHQDSSWFGYSVDQVEEAIKGQGELEWTGQAIVEVRAGDEYPYKLESITRTEADTTSSPDSLSYSNPANVDLEGQGQAEFWGTIEREELTTEQTMMAWSAVVYWLVFDEPVHVTYTDTMGSRSNDMDRITVCQLESYDMDGATNVNAELPNMHDEEWDSYIGKKVKVEGGIVDTGNAHTIGLCKFTDARVTDVAPGGNVGSEVEAGSADDSAERRAHIEEVARAFLTSLYNNGDESVDQTAYQGFSKGGSLQSGWPVNTDLTFDSLEAVDNNTVNYEITYYSSLQMPGAMDWEWKSSYGTLIFDSDGDVDIWYLEDSTSNRLFRP